MVNRVTISCEDDLFDVYVVAGRAICDVPELADVVNAAVDTCDPVEVTATGPFRCGLRAADSFENVEYVAGVLSRLGFPVVSTDPELPTYPLPPGAVG